MSACREKNVQVTVAEAAIHNLIQLCPLMLDALSACAPDVRELLDNAAMSSEMREGTGGFLRMNKRRKERSTVSKYGRNEELSFIVAIWKYESLRAVFTDLIRVILLLRTRTKYYAHQHLWRIVSHRWYWVRFLL